MAGQTVIVSVLADTKKFSNAMRNLGNETGFNKLAAGAAVVGKGVALATAAVAGATIAWGVQSVQSLARIEQIAAQTDAAISSTGGAAGRTRDQIDKLAGSIEDMSGVEAETITQGQNLLLTFTNIKGANFDRATEAMVDMGVAMNKGSVVGVDFAAASVQIGKALNDPIKGVTALSKVGVQFTEDQKKMIESMVLAGDTAGAQGVILKELEVQFGGTAAAAGETTIGKWERVKHAFGTLGETIFAKVLPAVSGLTDFLLEKGIPAFDRFAAWVEDNVVPALGKIGDWIAVNVVPRLKMLASWFTDTVVPALKEFAAYITDTVIPGLKTFGEWIVKNQDWLKAIAVTVGLLVVGIMTYVKVMAIWRAAVAVATTAQVLFNTVMAANPIGLIILAVTALVAGLVYFFTQTDTGRAIVETAWASIQKAIQAVADWWTNTAGPAISGAWDAVVNFFKVGAEKVSGFFQGLWDFLFLVFSWTPLGIIVTNWAAITNFFSTSATKIKNFFASAGTWLSTAGSNIIAGLKGGIVAGWTAVSTWFLGVGTAIGNTFTNAGTWLYTAGKNILQGLVDGITSAWTSVKNKLTELTNKIPDWKGPREKDKTLLKGAGSLIIGGLVEGIEDKFSGVRSTLGTLTDMIAGTDLGTLEADARVNIVPGSSMWDTYRASTAPADTGRTYQITVQALAPNAEVGRAVTEAIRAFERTGGR